MVTIILFRGPAAAGKTTIATHLLKEIKKEGIKPAFISEDNFRKRLQFKYKSGEKKAHLNSVIIIKTVIDKLLEIDDYDLIVIEGLLRYPEMVNKYKEYCKKRKFKFQIFQFQAPFEVRKKRDKVSVTRDHITGLGKRPIQEEEESFTIKGSIIIDTTKDIEKSVKLIRKKLITN